MKRYVLEGMWRGYSSSMDRVVHREVIPGNRKKLLEWLRQTFCIRYTDGTTLELSVRECLPRERVQEKAGYTSLIRDCFYANTSSVEELSRIKQEQREGWQKEREKEATHEHAS